ncbi:hypothetical protein GCM10027168_10730 [Streptomyces capparidis]
MHTLTTQEEAADHDRPRHPGPAPAQHPAAAPHPGPPLSPQAVLRLQRLAGNRAARTVVPPPRTTVPPAPAALAVQRCGPVPCDCTEEERARKEGAAVQRDCDPTVASCPPEQGAPPEMSAVDTETALALAEIDARGALATPRSPQAPPGARPALSVLRSDGQYAVAATAGLGLVASGGGGVQRGLLASEALAAEGTAAAQGLAAAHGARTATAAVVEGSSLARTLIAGGETILAVEAAGAGEVEAAAGPPGWVIGAVVLLAAGTAIGVGYLLLRDPATAPQASAQPQTSPQTSAQPQAVSRRHPNQTCDDSVLDALQAEKDRICNSIPGTSCSPSKVSPKRLARTPCSEIRLRIAAMRACMAIRQRIQDECFGGRPDQAHQDAMDFLRNGINHCLALEAQNCAPGHPMAGR